MIPRSTPDAGCGTPMYTGSVESRLSVAQWREVFGSVSQHPVYAERDRDV